MDQKKIMVRLQESRMDEARAEGDLIKLLDRHLNKALSGSVVQFRGFLPARGPLSPGALAAVDGEMGTPPSSMYEVQKIDRHLSRALDRLEKTPDYARLIEKLSAPKAGIGFNTEDRGLEGYVRFTLYKTY